MKKRLLILICSALLLSRLFASDEYQLRQSLVGYVYGSTAFTVTIIEEVLPFNLESSAVAENPTPTTKTGGLRIGYYSLTSNIEGFKMYILHDKLHLVARTFGVDDKTLSDIDYRLYLELGSSIRFKSCLSAINPEEPETESNCITIMGSDSSSWMETGVISLIDQSIFISLEDSTEGPATVAELKAGTYSSNIYFYIEAGQ